MQDFDEGLISREESVEFKREITLEEIEKYIKSKYKHKTKIENNVLVIEKDKHRVTININETSKESCFRDSKWISIGYFNTKKIRGRGYGINISEYNTDIIDEELKEFEMEN